MVYADSTLDKEVYVLTEGFDYEGEGFVGVFSSLKNAEVKIDELRLGNLGLPDFYMIRSAIPDATGPVVVYGPYRAERS